MLPPHKGLLVILYALLMSYNVLYNTKVNTEPYQAYYIFWLIRYQGNTLPVHERPWLVDSSSLLAWTPLQYCGRRVVLNVVPCHNPMVK